MAYVPPGKYNVIVNKKTGKQYLIPMFNPAPLFKPRDRKKGNRYA